VKVRLIRERPQTDATSPASPASPAENLVYPYKRTKRSWDEVLAKFSAIDNKPTSEKDSEEN
jgi:hypothetical protein